MTDASDFFDGIGGSGAPGAKLSEPGDVVKGEIVELFKRDYVPYENRKTREPARNEDGSAVQQLVIILQTDHRNWENVSKVPKQDPEKDEGPDNQKDPSEDDGRRAVYVPQKKNIQFALGRAFQAAGAKPEVGGSLAVKVTGLRDIGRGNEMKEHQALYRPKPAPSAGDDFFGDEAKSNSAPQSPSQPAREDSQDPWGSSGNASDEPPF